jgi:hypothetical protein
MLLRMQEKQQRLSSAQRRLFHRSNAALSTCGKGEFRVAVGSPSGERSTVWKFQITRNDIYIFSRMMGSDTKVSLHESGECRWSATGSWVLKKPGRRNADRLLEKWQAPRPLGTAAAQIFQIGIPASELRISNLAEDLDSVHWLPAPPAGTAVALTCYIMPLSTADPAIAAPLPHPVLTSLQLADSRWLVVLHHTVPVDSSFLATLRENVCELARRSGIEIRPEFRACTSFTDVSSRGLIELCPAG